MQTTDTTINLRVITATDGYLLTLDPQAEYPYFCKTVYLGANDTPDRYIEVPEAEARRLTAEAEARRNTPTPNPE